MRTNIVFLSLTLCSALSLTACGDDGGADASTGADGTEAEAGTGEEGEATSAETSAETTAGDGDGDSGEAEATTGDGDGDATTGDGDGDTSGDGDGDTTGGTADCGGGSSFDVGPGAPVNFVTQLTVSSAVLNCDQALTIVAIGGEVSSVADGAGGCHVTIESISFEDVPPQSCDGAMLEIKDLSMMGDGDGTDTSSPSGGGAITGNQPVVVNGTVEGTGFPVVGDLDPTALEDFAGTLPEGSVAYGATDVTMSYANTDHVMATASPMVSIITVTVTLTGLTGDMTLSM